MSSRRLESSDVIEADIDAGRSIVIVPNQDEDWLTDKQLVDYRSYRRASAYWI